MSISVFMTLSPMIILSSATCPVFQLSMLAWDGAAPDTNMPHGWVGRLCNWPCKGEQFTKSAVSRHKDLRSRMIRRGERGWVGKGGPLWSPVGDGGSGSVPRVERDERRHGRPKRPSQTHRTTIAPTESWDL